MGKGCAVVLDVGKTLPKLTLWSPDGQLVDRQSRRNSVQGGGAYPALDVQGTIDWLGVVLAGFARQGEIAAIIPVAHGAAAVVLTEDGGWLPPVDYEAEIPADIRTGYSAVRDPFAVTGSPALPAGLNLGAQLFWLDALEPDNARRGTIVTWPQFWAWLLSGVAASEVSSLGTHTDLWCPANGCPSPLSQNRGWAPRMAPLRRACDVLGPVREEWRVRCGLPEDCVVLCGVHDSNAALLAARLHSEAGTRELTVLSTGTWFIAMRSGGAPAALAETRDCLINVDVFGAPVPSSRFMGGREVELIEDGAPIDAGAEADALLRRAQRLIADDICALPGFQRGVGPFPDAAGGWTGVRPGDALDRRAAASLYLALMADTSLDLIGSAERLVIEGRFAADTLFTRALAALRPQQSVYLSEMADNVPLGALSLFNPDIGANLRLESVAPLDIDLSGYAARWRAAAQGERPARQRASA